VEILVRFDRCPVLPFLDDDGVIRTARLLAQRRGRVYVMVTRDVGATHLLWRDVDCLVRDAPGAAAD
jgi:hypothetical protein